MKELRKQFTGIGEVKGYEFTQISTTSTGFLYEVNQNGLTYYEVFKRVENTRFAVVSYPSSKAFGVWAWRYRDLQQAQNKLNTL